VGVARRLRKAIAAQTAERQERLGNVWCGMTKF
jgi:hypothetical protein